MPYDLRMFQTIALVIARRIPEPQLLTELSFQRIGDSDSFAVFMVYDDYRYTVTCDGCNVSSINVHSYDSLKDLLTRNLETDLMQQVLLNQRSTLKLTRGDLLREVTRMVGNLSSLEHEIVVESSGRPLVKDPDVTESECIAIFLDENLGVDDRVSYMEQVSKQESEKLYQLYMRMQ